MDKKMLLICVDGMRADYLKNPDVNIPNISYLSENGGTVERLSTVFPSATWGAHTSVVTGCYPSKHGILGNNIFDRDSHCSRSYFNIDTGLKHDLIKMPTIYDKLHERGGVTASICWPLTQGAETIAYNIPEFYKQEYFENYTTESYWNKLKELKIPVHRYGEWSADHSKGAMQDWLTNQIVSNVIETLNTDMIMAHYLLIDSFLHDFGNDTPEAYWAIEYVDLLIGKTLEFLDSRKELDKTDIIIFSDHGHCDVTYDFHPNKLLLDMGLNMEKDRKGSGYVAVGNGGCIYLYGNSDNKGLQTHVYEIFKSLRHVKNIILKEDFRTVNMPEVSKENYNSCPDIIVELIPGFCSRDSVNVEETVVPALKKSTHGYHPDFNLMDGFMVMKGPSFNKGMYIKRAGLIDIAPTISEILKLSMNNCDGGILSPLLNT